VVWSGPNYPDVDVFARRFSSSGAALGGELLVNTYTPGAQGDPTVAVDADGDFVVAWSSAGQDGSSSGIFARRFTSSGLSLDGEFQVNAHTLDVQQTPSASARGDGALIFAWASARDGSAQGIFARRFSSAGVSLGGEFQINTHTEYSQGHPSAAAAANGEFVIAWESVGQENTGDSAVIARRFSSDGSPVTGEVVVNTSAKSNQVLPSVAVAGGRFVVAWQSEEQDGAAYGIFAQRFAELAVLDIDGNGSTAPLTDGLLVLRFLFGFTGVTLTSGAVDVAGCTRCSAPAIESYLQTLI
jgi:hypothetical protein